MKILFVAPRFHTNQYYLIKNLKKKNQILFISLFKGKTEDYRLIKPIVLKQSFLSKKIQKLFKFRFDTFYFPNFFQFFSILKKAKPDLVILRVYSRPLLYITSILTKILRAKSAFEILPIEPTLYRPVHSFLRQKSIILHKSLRWIKTISWQTISMAVFYLKIKIMKMQ